jgi:hypothetical protein
MADEWDRPLMYLRIDREVPCGMPACGRPAHVAIAEPDPAHPGMWTILPICEGCAARFALGDDGIPGVGEAVAARDK